MDAIIRWLTEKGGAHVIEFINEQAKELKIAKQEAATARSDRDAAFDRATAATGKLRAAESDLTVLKADYDETQAKIKGAMDYRVKLEAKISELESASGKLLSQCDSLEAELESKRQDNANLQSLLDEAERKIVDGKQKIAQIADFVTARK